MTTFKESWTDGEPRHVAEHALIAKFLNRLTIEVTAYGAVGDGITDDTAAIRAAIAAASAGKTVMLPQGTYKVTDTLTLSLAMTLQGPGTIKMALPSDHATGKLINVTATGVTIDGITLDATGLGPYTTVTRYGICFTGTSGTHLTTCKVTGCTFTNLAFGNGTPPYATHAVQAIYVDGLVIERCQVSKPSGAAFLISNCTAIKIDRNEIANTGWYSICLQTGNSDFEISSNKITGSDSGIRNWGGSIYVMSDGAAQYRGNIHHNYISGLHTYASGAIEIASAQQVVIDANIIEGLTQPDNDEKHIRVMTRFVSGTSYGPSSHITISNNILRANTAYDQGIYVDNQGAEGAQAAARGLVVRGNQMISPDDTHYFRGCVWVHGQQGGWEDIVISDNILAGIPTGSPLSGLIGLAALSGKPVQYVTIAGNKLRFSRSTAADDSAQVGIGVDAYADHITARDNSITGFRIGYKNYANSGSDQREAHNNQFAGNTLLDVACEVAPAYDSQWQIVKTAWNAGSISANSYVQKEVTVTGLPMTALVVATHDGIGANLIGCHAAMHDVATVTVTLYNHSSSPVTVNGNVIVTGLRVGVT